MNAWAGSIEVHAMRTGRDWLFSVTGGDAHIGASSTAYYEYGLAKVMTLQMPGHREGQLTAELSKLACERLKTTVAVVAGIHFDDVCREDIARIVKEAKKQMELTLERLCL